MEIIQASSCCCCSSPSLVQFYPRFSTGIHLKSRISPDSSISLLKPKISHRAAVTTRALTDNTTSDSVVTKVVERDLSVAIKNKALEISSDLKGTSIFLVGINSSYKSGMGQILADALRYYYFDSDSLVEEAAGGKSNVLSSIESDEDEYSASETEVLKQLSSMGRLVVSAGNGAVKSSTNLALLRHGISIWIDVPLELVAKDLEEERIQLSAFDTATCKSSSEIVDQVAALYSSGLTGYSTADATISLQSESERERERERLALLSYIYIYLVSFLFLLTVCVCVCGAEVGAELGYGYDEVDAVSVEDMCMEVLKEIEKLMRVKKMMEDAARPF